MSNIKYDKMSKWEPWILRDGLWSRHWFCNAGWPIFVSEHPHFLPCVLRGYLDWQMLNLRPRRQNLAQSECGCWVLNTFLNQQFSLAARINEHPQKYRLQWSKEQLPPTHKISLSHFGGLSQVVFRDTKWRHKDLPFLVI